ncbi:acyl-CoA dehydrogenase family protein [Streptomyces sp. NPDC001139]
MAGLLPEDGQRELWEGGADTAVVAALRPSGTAERCTGGWLLTGNWSPLSGIDAADWVLLCVSTEAETLGMAVPCRGLQILDTWRTIGMRGTGSNTVALEKVFVPAHRTVPWSAILCGRLDVTAACHRAPLPAIAPPLFVAPLVGVVNTALASLNGDRRRQPAYTRAVAEVETAWALVEQAAGAVDAGDTSPERQARTARTSALAAELLVSAADRVFAMAGTRAQRESDPLQRAWRDIHCAASHAALQMERAAALFPDLSR